MNYAYLVLLIPAFFLALLVVLSLRQRIVDAAFREAMRDLDPLDHLDQTDHL